MFFESKSLKSFDINYKMGFIFANNCLHVVYILYAERMFSPCIEIVQLQCSLFKLIAVFLSLCVSLSQISNVYMSISMLHFENQTFVLKSKIAVKIKRELFINQIWWIFKLLNIVRMWTSLHSIEKYIKRYFI